VGRVGGRIKLKSRGRDCEDVYWMSVPGELLHSTVAESQFNIFLVLKPVPVSLNEISIKLCAKLTTKIAILYLHVHATCY
jgi:hypothetical protein